MCCVPVNRNLVRIQDTCPPLREPQAVAVLHQARAYRRMTSATDARRVLLLDLDGTLADSLGVMREVYERFLTDRGAVPTEAEFTALNGPPLREIIRRLKATHSLPGTENSLLPEYQDAIDSHYRNRVLPSAGSVELLSEAKRRGYVTAVVTSNARHRTLEWLTGVNLLQWVDHIVAGEDVKAGKPNPEPYLLALAKAKCSARYGMAVEDSSQGAQAAVAAGVRTFVLCPAGCAPAGLPAGVERISMLNELVPLL